MEARAEAGEKFNPDQEAAFRKLREKFAHLTCECLTSPFKGMGKQPKKRRPKRKQTKPVRIRNEHSAGMRQQSPPSTPKETRRQRHKRRRQMQEDKRQRRWAEEHRRAKEEEERHRRARRVADQAGVNSICNRVPSDVITSIQHCITKQQLRKYRRSALRKYHPDRGGDLEVSQAINNFIDVCLNAASK